ncbi:MAG: hypothetical protein KC503_36165 [Myxococcales bacterium]|nr:hypothetical protein [Myxococcales bacterium]
MIWPVVIWGAAVPAALSLVLFALAIKLAPGARSKAQTQAHEHEHERARWAAALAMGAAYIAAQLGLDGGPNAGEITERMLFWIALAAIAIGVLEGAWQAMPATLRWALRVVGAGAVGYALASPLASAQHWSSAALAGWVLAIGSALVLVWTVLDSVAAREPGPSLAMALSVVGGLGAAVLVLSNLATGARVAGALAAAAGGAMLVTWRAPAEGRLRSAAPLISAALVTHWAIAVLYGEMPKATFALLVIAPAALLLARVPRIKRASAVLALAVRLGVLSAPMAGGLALAASKYFAGQASAGGGYGAPPTPTTSSTTTAPGGKPGTAAGSTSDDDYGYD